MTRASRSRRQTTAPSMRTRFSVRSSGRASWLLLPTARSVRRHARLVDYHLHEGCNARAWVCVEVKPDLKLDDPTDIAFITGLNQALTAPQNVLSSELLRDVPPHSVMVGNPARVLCRLEPDDTPDMRRAALEEFGLPLPECWGREREYTS